MSNNNSFGEPNSHNNKWGGKNNVWGKRKSSGPQRDDETWSKGAKIVVCCVVGFVLLKGGYKGVLETASNIKDVFVPKKEVVNTVDNKNIKNDNNNVGYQKVDVDIDYDDVVDIVEDLLNDSEYKDKDFVSEISTSNNVFVDYSAFYNKKNFEKKVGKDLDNYSESVTYFSVGTENLDSDALNKEFERIAEVIGKSEVEGSFTKFDMSIVPNKPNNGEYLVVLTFS